MFNLRSIMLALVLGLTSTIYAQDVSDAKPVDADGQLPTLTSQKEMATFLGVAARPISPTLASQLQLPRGVGLVVFQVAKDSPAQRALLREHDVLHKLNEQLLINSHQLAVLVRSFSAPTQVKLTIIRGGKSIVVPVNLSEKELPALGDWSVPGPYYLDWDFPGGSVELHPRWLQLTPQQEQAWEEYLERTIDDSRQSMETLSDELEEVLSELREQSSAKARKLREKLDLWWDKAKVYTDEALENLQQTLREEPARTIIFSEKLFTYQDNEHHIKVEEDNQGNVTLLITAIDGEVLHEGPLSSAEDLRSLPEAVRVKVDTVLVYLRGGVASGDLHINIFPFED